MMAMFEGEKTTIFYTGLFIFGASLFGLFSTLWTVIVVFHDAWKVITPFAFGAAVFLVIGYYLMTIGVRKPPPPPKE
jgi:hypothetical protein